MQEIITGIIRAAGLTFTFSESLPIPNVSLTSSLSYSGSVSGSVSASGSGVVSLPSFFLQEKLSPKSALN